MSISPQPTPRLPPRRVLEDASGRRLQRMRWVGRATALLFLGWLALVILGGLGVGPVARLPLGNVLRPSAGPPPLRHIPQPVAPKPADLVPALPAPVAAPPTTTTPSATTRGKSAVAPGHTKTTTTTRGRSAVAPGHTKTTHTKTTTTTRGRSAGAPGHTKTITTTTTTTTTTTVPGKKLGHGKKP